MGDEHSVWSIERDWGIFGPNSEQNSKILLLGQTVYKIQKFYFWYFYVSSTVFVSSWEDCHMLDTLWTLFVIDEIPYSSDEYIIHTSCLG